MIFDVKRYTLKTKQDPPALRPKHIRLIDISLGKFLSCLCPLLKWRFVGGERYPS